MQVQRMRTIKQAMEHVRSVDPETALTETCQHFIGSFSEWEAALSQDEK